VHNSVSGSIGIWRCDDLCPLDKVVVEAEFAYDESEQAALAAIHRSAAGITGVRISKNYKGTFTYNSFLPKNPDQQHDVKWVISVIEDKVGAAPENASEHFKNQYKDAIAQFIKDIRANTGSEYAVAHTDEFKKKYSRFHHPNNPPNNRQFVTDQSAIESLNIQMEEAVAELKTAPPRHRSVAPSTLRMNGFRHLSTWTTIRYSRVQRSLMRY